MRTIIREEDKRFLRVQIVLLRNKNNTQFTRIQIYNNNAIHETVLCVVYLCITYIRPICV